MRYRAGWLNVMACGLVLSGVAASSVAAEIQTNSLGMKLVLVPAGEFLMGSPESEPGHKPSEKQHRVTLSRPYYIGQCEVTQAQYEEVMGQNPAQTKGPNHPVDRVTWFDAVAFCEQLSELEKRTYRLPTEAEWEYAARAGSSHAWCFGPEAQTLPEYGWISSNSGGKGTHPVGTRHANRWEIYDMFGNVAEWCQDWQGDYPGEAVTDPTGPAEGNFRVVRGGSGSNSTNYCRAATRVFAAEPTHVDAWYGFRVVLETTTE